MEPALFSPAHLFGEQESDEDITTTSLDSSEFAERSHDFSGTDLLIREFAFHEVNANLLWPGTLFFAKWLKGHQSLLQGRRILELGSGTGALAIYLKKALSMDITTSDFYDEVIENNIAYNCKANGVTKLPHIRHTWGDRFPEKSPDWDLILASDILLYVTQYANLIKTVSFLLQNYTVGSDFKYCSGTFNTNGGEICKLHKCSLEVKIDSEGEGSKVLVPEGIQLPRPCFLMSWRRRLPKEHEALFFDGCKEIGLSSQHLGSRVYCIFQN